jgi:hypothetical protein
MIGRSQEEADLKRLVAGLLAALMVASTAGAAWAHHGLAREFDMERRVVLKGKITRVFWQNPHIYYTLDVRQPNGAIQTYNIESVPVAMARNAGLTPARLQGGGQEVEVTIRPGLKDPHLGFGVYLKYADGYIVTFEGFRE